MLQNCLYVVGIIALPLAVEVLLAPRPCLVLLWGGCGDVDGARRAREIRGTRSFANAAQNSRTRHRWLGKRDRIGALFPSHMVLTDPRLLDTSTSTVLPMSRQTGEEAILHGGTARGGRFRSPVAGRQASLNK